MSKPLTLAELELTRTPLGASADPARAEELHAPKSIIQHATVRLTDSIGTQVATLHLNNQGGRFDDYAPGDAIKIRARTQATNITLLDGVLASHEPGHESTALNVTGWNYLLDHIIITEAKEYLDNKYTDIVDDLATTYLTGWTRSITTDAATIPRWRVEEGVTLRAALDALRLALVATTSAAWKYELAILAGTKTFRWFKLNTASQRTFRPGDVDPGKTRRIPGALQEVVNRAKVLGATVPSQTVDKLGVTKAGSVKTTTADTIIAQPFNADDTPLYSVQWKGDRSLVSTPPTLNGTVARNSDNKDHLSDSIIRGLAATRSYVDATGVANVNDDDYSTGSWLAPVMPNDDTWRELVMFDLGSAKEVHAVLIRTQLDAGVSAEVQFSDNDSTWTLAMTIAGGAEFSYLASVESHRYWRIRVKSTTSNATTRFYEWGLLPYQNLSSDVTNPKLVHDRTILGGDSRVSSTGGGVIKEVARFNFRAAKAVAKLLWQHSETTTDANYQLEVQKSSDGSAWSLVAKVSPSLSTVTDTMFLEDADFQYLRFVTRDDRGGGSASEQCITLEVQAILHTATFDRPLTGDALLASTVSWATGDLAARPGTATPKTYSAPNLALTKSRKYWRLWRNASGGSSTSYWELDYGTQGGATAALKSTDAGSTWASVAANAVMLYKQEFNRAQLVGTSNDATSQTKYASLVPGGIFGGSVVQEELTTQDMVDKVAAAWTARRGDVRDRYEVATALDLTATVGQRVTLDVELQHLTGKRGATANLVMDAVGVEHHFPSGEDAYTLWLLGEHPPDFAAAFDWLATVAGRGRV